MNETPTAMADQGGGAPPRPRGRPRKHTAKRSSFNTRIRDELKTRLEAAAAKAGRSLSEEIEFRLERSFEIAELKQIAMDLHGLAERFKEVGNDLRAHRRAARGAKTKGEK